MITIKDFIEREKKDLKEYFAQILKFKENDTKDYKIKDLENKTFTQNSYELDDKYLQDMERASLYDVGLDTWSK